MASATKEAVSVTMVTLVITEDEARTLAEVCYRVGGPPSTTRRGHIDRIGQALTAVGVYPAGEHPIGFDDVDDDVSGSIVFSS